MDAFDAKPCSGASSVLVVGSGIAGVVAAIEAACAGANVFLACVGPLFGGSSFYPGTWGLGLVGPANSADEDELIQTILKVGGGVANPQLVEVFVRNICPSIAWIEQACKVELMHPASSASAKEAAFIPCFDHKHRMWRGITRNAFANAMQRELSRLNVKVFEHYELLALLDTDGGVINSGTEDKLDASGEVLGLDTERRLGEDARKKCANHKPSSHTSIDNNKTAGGDKTVGGALFFDQHAQHLKQLNAQAVILATGGTSGLFERSLTGADVLSSAQGIALNAGCKLTNIEFMQMMPGLVAPKRGLVFNEKTFRYARFTTITTFCQKTPPRWQSCLSCARAMAPLPRV